MHQQFLEVNLIMGALAWTGYLEKSRGAVVVYASQEDEDPLENLQGKIDYLSTEEALQSYQRNTIASICESIRPHKAIVVHCDIEASLVDSWQVTLTPPARMLCPLQGKKMLEFGSAGDDSNGAQRFFHSLC